MLSRSLGHRAPLLWLVVPFAAGIAIGAKLDTAQTVGWLIGAALGAIAALVASWRAPSALGPVAVATMALAGLASVALHRSHADGWESLPPREAGLVLRIDRVFATTNNRRSSGLATVVEAEGPARDLAGQRVYYAISLRPPEPAPLHSAVVRAVGILSAVPADPPPTSFDGYLANAGVGFRLGRAHVTATVTPATAYRRFCAAAAQRLSSILGRGVETKKPPLVAIYRAMLLGEQHELSEDQVALFRQTGTMHVFSISGLHIAAVATGLYGLLALLRSPRALRYGLSLAVLWLYVDITGTAPSAVRAFIMVALVETALLTRAPRNPISALVTSALVVLVVAPRQLFSASFQMSYGIVAALLLVGLPLASCWQEKLALFQDLPKVSWGRLRRWLGAGWHGLLGVVAIGVAASLVSAITGVAFFGLLTPGSFVTNLWLIPASTFVIFCGFVSLLAGLAGLTAVSLLANHAAVLVLWAVDAGVQAVSTWPGMWMAGTFRWPWLGAAALTALLAAMVAGYSRNWAGWQRGYWTPFAVVAAVLAFGVRYG